MESCLANTPNLAYVEFPESLYSIRTQAFINCYSIKERDITGAINLKKIENSAFNSAFGVVEGERTFIIPANVDQLGAIAFGYNEGAISTWQIGEKGRPSQLQSLYNVDPFNWNWDPYNFIIYTDNPDPESEPWRSIISNAGSGTVQLKDYRED